MIAQWRNWLFSGGLTALLVSLIWGLAPAPASPDAATYRQLAQGMAWTQGGGWIVFSQGVQETSPPFYAALLALGQRLVPYDVITVAKGMDRAVALVFLILVFLLGEEFFGRWAGFAATMLLLISPFVVRTLYSVPSMAELQLVWMLLAIMLWVWGVRHRRMWCFALSGLAWALAFWTSRYAILWLPLPLLAFLLTPEIRSKRFLRALVGLYGVLFLLILPWWLWIWRAGEGVYLTTWFQRRFPAWSPTWFDLIFAIWLGLLYLLWRFDALHQAWKTRQWPVFLWTDLGVMMTGFWVLLLTPAFTLAQLDLNWRAWMQPFIDGDLLLYLWIWAGVYGASRLRRQPTPALIAMFLAYILASPLVIDMWVWAREPQYMLAVFVFSAFWTGALIVLGIRRLGSALPNRSPGWLRAAGVIFLTVIGILSVWMIQDKARVAEANTAMALSPVAICAEELIAYAQPGEVVVVGPHDGEWMVRTVSNGFRSIFAPLRRDRFRLVADGGVFTSQPKLAVGLADATLTPLLAFYHLDAPEVFAMMNQVNADYLAVETALNGYAAPLGVERYFDRHPQFEPLCKASDGLFRMSVYRVRSRPIRPESIAFVDSTAFPVLSQRLRGDPLWPQRLNDQVGFWPWWSEAAEAYSQIGHLYEAQGEFDLASEALKRWVVLASPNDAPDVLFSWGLRWRAEASDDPWAALALATLYAIKQEKGAAEQAIAMALAHDPNDPMVYRRAAAIYRRLGQKQEAGKLEGLIVTRWPATFWAYDMNAWLDAGAWYAKEGMMSLAARAYQRALKVMWVAPNLLSSSPFRQHVLRGKALLGFASSLKAQTHGLRVNQKTQ